MSARIWYIVRAEKLRYQQSIARAFRVPLRMVGGGLYEQLAQEIAKHAERKESA